MNFYVYAHYHSEDQIFYIGKGRGNRAWRDNSRTDFWKNIVNKYGYQVIIIANNLDESTAFELEKYLIKEYGRRDLGKGPLVNQTDGGDGTSGSINNLRGDEHHASKPVICIETGEIFETGRAASLKYNIDPTNLSSACRKGKGSVAGLHFQFLDDKRIMCLDVGTHKNGDHPMAKSIICNETGVVFETAREAGRTLQISYKDISYYLTTGKARTKLNGYTFKYYLK
jgi:hypothetical protein